MSLEYTSYCQEVTSLIKSFWMLDIFLNLRLFSFHQLVWQADHIKRLKMNLLVVGPDRRDHILQLIRDVQLVRVEDEDDPVDSGREPVNPD